MTSATLGDIQANVFRRVRADLDRTELLFVKLGPGSSPGDLLTGLLDESWIRSDADARNDDGVRRVAALGLTRPGLERFGEQYVPLELRGGGGGRPGDPNDFADPFLDGMKERRVLLGDIYGDAEFAATAPAELFDCLIWLVHDGQDSHLRELKALVRDTNNTWWTTESAGAQDPGLLFGYRDGISQPYLSEFEGGDGVRERLPGGGTITPSGWQPVRGGEFILGLTDEGHERDIPGPVSVCRHGTFLVYRKYRLHEERFEEFLGDSEARSGLSRSVIAAKVMGRYRAGQAPGTGPAARTGATQASAPRLDDENDFQYLDDNDGYVCPLGAHIRRANPRDSLGFDGDLTRRHRILRRGVVERGPDGTHLHFIALNARIRDQFEFIQRLWLNSGDAFRLGGDRDLFAGAPRTGEHPGEQFVVQGRRPEILHAPRPFADLLWGEYFLVPGMSGLRMLRSNA